MDRFENFVERMCERVATLAPAHRTITRGDNEPYLDRYYFFRREWLRDWFGARGWGIPPILAKIPSVYLHHFLKGDDEEELHNHPWKMSVSLILTGGYHEERRVGNEIHSRIVKPWSFNVIRAEDFHKVELLDKERGVWTIFVAGMRGADSKESWGFWHPKTKGYLDWKDHVSLRKQMISIVRRRDAEPNEA